MGSQACAHGCTRMQTSEAEMSLDNSDPDCMRAISAYVCPQEQMHNARRWGSTQSNEAGDWGSSKAHQHAGANVQGQHQTRFHPYDFRGVRQVDRQVDLSWLPHMLTDRVGWKRQAIVLDPSYPYPCKQAEPN